MDGFRYVHETDVRFRDLDTMGHVNNAVYATYLEEARVAYYDDVIDTSADDLGFVLAHFEIDYKRPIEHGETVAVGLRMSEVSDKSMTTEYRIEADGDLAAEAETVQVAVDEQGKATNLHEGWRRAVEEFEEGQ
jgi:acyl-CoA thioester hydrolase